MGVDPISLIGIGLSAISGIKLYQSQKEAAKAQKASIAAQERKASVDNQRERIKNTREARIRRAMIEGSTMSQGLGTGTSGYAGGAGAVSSQFAGNVGYSNQVEGFAAQASAANQRAVDAQSSASMWQTVGGISQSFIKPTMPSGWDSMFNKNNKVTIGGG